MVVLGTERVLCRQGGFSGWCALGAHQRAHACMRMQLCMRFVLPCKIHVCSPCERRGMHQRMHADTLFTCA